MQQHFHRLSLRHPRLPPPTTTTTPVSRNAGRCPHSSTADVVARGTFTLRHCILYFYKCSLYSCIIIFLPSFLLLFFFLQHFPPYRPLYITCIVLRERRRRRQIPSLTSPGHGVLLLHLSTPSPRIMHISQGAARRSASLGRDSEVGVLFLTEMKKARRPPLFNGEPSRVSACVRNITGDLIFLFVSLCHSCEPLSS